MIVGNADGWNVYVNNIQIKNNQIFYKNICNGNEENIKIFCIKNKTCWNIFLLEIITQDIHLYIYTYAYIITHAMKYNNANCHQFLLID